MKSRFYFFSRLVVLLLFGNAFAFAAENKSPQSETPFQIFETQVYPFLQQKCAGCHGDNQFDAPQHSPRNDAQTSYQKIRGYVHIAPDWEKTSRLITFGGTRHCKEYTGDDSCGTDHNELISTVRNWINAEISAKSEDPQTSNRSAKNLLPTPQKKNIETESAKTKRSLKIIQISTGGTHACALFENGKAKCWGGNSYGQLGLGSEAKIVGDTLEEMKSLHYVKITEPIQQIAAGLNHTCALLQRGRAKCWGANHYGQLGIGSSHDMGTTAEDMNSLPDVKITEPISQIFTGNAYTCVLFQSGKAKCWGFNEDSQLGIGSNKKSFGTTPEEMTQLPYVMIDESIKQMSLNAYHTCALLQNGRAKCWGDNYYGQLGLGSKAQTVGKTPEEMKALPDVQVDSAEGKIIQISNGMYHTCALLESQKARCWGSNSSNQLGISLSNLTIGKQSMDMKLFSHVAVIEPIFQITANASSTCALIQSDSHSAKCWGSNEFGQLGSGINELTSGSTLDEMKNLPFVMIHQKILQISSSGDRTCFLLETNKIKCIGNNFSAQLGTGDTIDRGIYDVDGIDELPDALVIAEEE